MLHLLLPLVVGAWLVASAWASDHLVSLLGNVLPDRAWRMVVELLVFAVLLPLPLADELLARPAFAALCSERAQLTVHAPASLGPQSQRMRLRPEPVDNLGLGVLVQPWWVLGEGGGLVLASYNTVEARGGWLARWASDEPGHRPLSFKGYCEPHDLEGRLQPRLPRDPHGATLGRTSRKEHAERPDRPGRTDLADLTDRNSLDRKRQEAKLEGDRSRALRRL